MKTNPNLMALYKEYVSINARLNNDKWTGREKVQKENRLDEVFWLIKDIEKGEK